MFDLLELVKTRGQQLLTGQTFDQPDGEQVALRWYKYVHPPKRLTTDQGRDYPFAHLWINGIDDDGINSTVTVRIVAGVYKHPDTDIDGDIDADDAYIDAAASDMDRLLTGMRGLGVDGNYSPYSFERLSVKLGDENGPFAGLEYYDVIIDLVFAMEPMVTNY